MTAPELSAAELATVERFGLDAEWEFGFYDSYDSTQTIWWYVFGLPHKSAESARHTADKNYWGPPVIVRRRKGESEWEVLAGDTL